MKNYNTYKETRNNQQIIVDSLSNNINSFEKNINGLVIESIRMSNEFKQLKNQFDIEFKKLQNINLFGAKNFKKELRKERLSKRK